MSVPEPALQQVTSCRCCGSTRLLDARVSKRYYLINVDRTIELAYAVCQDCQFICQAQYVGDEFLNYYYASSPMLRRKEPTPFEVDQNRRQAGFLCRHLNMAGKRVLEIGAHAGAFLVHLHRELQCEAYFDELSEEARQVLSSQPGLRDLRAAPADVKMDLVVLRHVLEHIFDLDAFLRYVDSVLHADGRLFIEVPDWSYLDEHTDPLIFEHLSQFSTHNLMLLMRRTGWQCEAIEKSRVADDPATPNRVQRLIFSKARVPAPGDLAIADAFGGFLDQYYGKANRAIDARLRQLDPQRRIALYPASHLTFTALAETQLRRANIVGMFDIDTKKHGRIVEGIEIYPAAALKDTKPDLIFLFTMAYEREIRESFVAMGVNAEVISITQLVTVS